MLSRGFLLALLLCVACSSIAPATTPQQLHATPGAYISVRESRFFADGFTLDYPANWRVVKLSGADTSWLRVAFVAPDGSAVYLSQLEQPDSDSLLLENGVALRSEIEPAESASARFHAQAQRIIESIRA